MDHSCLVLPSGSRSICFHNPSTVGPIHSLATAIRPTPHLVHVKPVQLVKRSTVSRFNMKKGVVTLFVSCLFCLVVAEEQDNEEIPYYVYPCPRNDPDVEACLTYAANHLAQHFRQGVPELGIVGLEPVIIDEIQLALGSGPDGYRAIFKDIKAYGVSNITVTGVRTDLDTYQFQLSFFIPKISSIATYRSSGVLIMVKASGGGTHWGEYEGIRVKAYFRAQPHQVGKHVYLSVEEIKMDFSVQQLTMGIRDLLNGNTVLEGALNLMINTHAQELLKEMKPTLRQELTKKMKLFTANLLARIPYDMMVPE